MDRLGGIFGSRGAYDDEPDYSGPDYSGDESSGADFHGEDDDTFDAGPPSHIGQDERRMQVRAYNHWASLLADRNFPSIEDLDPASLKDFGPYSVLLDFTQGVDNPAVDYLGERLAEECSAQDAIDAVSEIPARSLLSRITDHYMQILANQAPIGFEAEFVNQRGATALYRGILLPYSSDDETIDFIFGVINWKEVADQQTADELLLEIGQALQADAAADEDPDQDERATMARGALELEQPVGRDDSPLELSVPVEDGDSDEAIPTHREPHELPVPAFGSGATAYRTDWPVQEWDDEEGEDEEDSSEAEWRGKPIGETARDYGLDDDYDEPELEDVDEVVDPLADDSVGVGLSALIGRGTKPRPTLDLPSAYSEETEPPVPQAYEPEDPQPEVSFVPAAPLSTDSDGSDDDDFDIDTFETVHSDDAPASAPENTDENADANTGENNGEAEGLYDCLAAARELALVASSSEDRSRDALYRAVGRAYDFSLEAAADPEGFEELIADSGLKVQERAPMTPVVKLVFGADYDKTRVTEYAAVLSHAHRLQVTRGSLARYLGEAEGGLKGVVQAERRARREESGEKVDDRASVRESLAKKLRSIEPLAFDDLDPEGAEFALVMVRRTEDGELLVVGEIPEDVPLVERAARKLLG